MLLHKFHQRRAAVQAEFDTLSYLSSNYNLDHWFDSGSFNGASSDGDSITSWGDLVSTNNATTGGTAPVLRIVDGRNYASFGEANGAFVMTEANFTAMGFNDSSTTMIFKTTDITNTSELMAFEKGKENRFSTAEYSLKFDTNSVTGRWQGASSSSVSVPNSIDGLWYIIRTSSTNTKIYTYLGGSSGISERASWTNGTSNDTGHLAFGGIYDESGFSGAGADWKCSDLLFFSQGMNTTQIQDVCDTIDDNT